LGIDGNCTDTSNPDNFADERLINGISLSYLDIVVFLITAVQDNPQSKIRGLKSLTNWTEKG
jgi:hypothetical protein